LLLLPVAAATALPFFAAVGLAGCAGGKSESEHKK